MELEGITKIETKAAINTIEALLKCDHSILLKELENREKKLGQLLLPIHTEFNEKNDLANSLHADLQEITTPLLSSTNTKLANVVIEIHNDCIKLGIEILNWGLDVQKGIGHYYLPLQELVESTSDSLEKKFWERVSSAAPDIGLSTIGLIPVAGTIASSIGLAKAIYSIKNDNISLNEALTATKAILLAKYSIELLENDGLELLTKMIKDRTKAVEECISLYQDMKTDINSIIS